MKLSADTRKFIVSALLATGLFYLIRYVFDRKKDVDPVRQPAITDENIEVAVAAYTDAQQRGEAKEVLDEMNNTFKTEYGFTLKRRTEDGRFLIRNVSGSNIKIV